MNGTKTNETTNTGTRLNRLVAVCRDPNADEQAREEAAQSIRLVLLRIAYRVRNTYFPGRFDTHTLQDVVQNAAVKLLDETKFSTEHKAGSFLGWGWKVIFRELCDLARSDKGTGSGHGAGDDPNDEDPIEKLPAPARLGWDWFREPFPDKDLQLLEEVQPDRDRIIILLYMGMHQKVPQTVWQKWCHAAGMSESVLADITGYGPERGRAKQIADALGMRRDAVFQIVSRKGGVLRRLRSVQDLLA